MSRTAGKSQRELYIFTSISLCIISLLLFSHPTLKVDTCTCLLDRICEGPSEYAVHLSVYHSLHLCHEPRPQDLQN
jgi:hypothetical protein